MKLLQIPILFAVVFCTCKAYQLREDRPQYDYEGPEYEQLREDARNDNQEDYASDVEEYSNSNERAKYDRNQPDESIDDKDPVYDMYDVDDKEVFDVFEPDGDVYYDEYDEEDESLDLDNDDDNDLLDLYRPGSINDDDDSDGDEYDEDQTALMMDPRPRPLWGVRWPRIPPIRIPRIRIPPIRIPRIPIPRIPIPRIPRIRLPRFPPIRIRIPRIPPIRIPIIRKIGRTFRRVVRKIGRGIRRVIIDAKRGIVRTAKTIGVGIVKTAKTFAKGVKTIVKKIPLAEIGRRLGRIVKETFRFLKCMAGGLGRALHCAKDVLSSLASCFRGECILRLGGKHSKCLALGKYKLSFRKKIGPITISGSIDPSASLGIYANLKTSAITAELFGKVGLSASISIDTKRRYFGNWKRRYTLTRRPKEIFRKLYMLMVGAVPVPLELLVTVQPVARLALDLKAQGSFHAGISYNNPAAVEIQNAKIEFTPTTGKVKFQFDLNKNFKTGLTKTLNIKASAEVSGSILLGPEIVVSLNGIPLKIFPALKITASGKISVSYSGHLRPPCVTGSLKAGVGVAGLVVPDLGKFLDAGKLFNSACYGVIAFTCKKNPAVNLVKCGSGGKVDPCKEAEKGCNKMGDIIKKNLPNPLKKVSGILNKLLTIVKPKEFEFKLPFPRCRG